MHVHVLKPNLTTTPIITLADLCSKLISVLPNPQLSAFAANACDHLEHINNSPTAPALYASAAAAAIVSLVMFSRVKGLFSGGLDDPTVINVKWNRERCDKYIDALYKMI